MRFFPPRFLALLLALALLCPQSAIAQQPLHTTPLLFATEQTDLTIAPATPADPTESESPAQKDLSAQDTTEVISMSYLARQVQALMDVGFPRSYAEPLAVLALSHPTWTFEPIFVPEDWEQVLYMEVDDTPARSLITKNEAYAAYRHSTNTALYDTGHYQASRDAVAYFMDPRNFINEADIFQFYCFTVTADCDQQAAVEAVLRGTFMENTDAGDGLTYAQTLIEVGKTIGLNPIYLAVRARQEQGVMGGMTVGGNAGELMRAWIDEGSHGAPVNVEEGEDLSRYNGYYNVFNIKASGTGSYTVLKNAMLRAMQGSPELADRFGEDTAWSTPAKSIWGGALFICNSYIKNDQNTVYLQKYNVSPDSDLRFRRQYMQHIVAALGEGRSLYTAFRAADALESECTFRIPVYPGIPEQGSPDPADGQCAYTAPSPLLLPFTGELKAGGKPYALPEDLATRLALGDIPILQESRTPQQGLLLSGRIGVVEPLDSLTLTLLAKNGEAIADGEHHTIYHTDDGCCALEMYYSRPFPDGAQTKDVYTYAVTLTLRESSRRCRTLTVALLEITVE